MKVTRIDAIHNFKRIQNLYEIVDKMLWIRTNNVGEQKKAYEDILILMDKFRGIDE